MYILIVDALRSLLDAARIRGKIKGIALPSEVKKLNKHFVDDSFISIQVDQVLGSVRQCLDVFCAASGPLVCDQKTDY